MTLLVVEDDDANRSLLVKLLRRDGYSNVTARADADGLLDVIAALRPELLLLDLHMPGRDGFAVMDELTTKLATNVRPQVVVLTGDHSREVRHRALESGAADFITKPYDGLEVLLRVRNLLRIRALQQTVERHNEHLESEVRARTAELDRTQQEIMERLARAADHRDDATGQHTRRVAELCARIAATIGLDDDTVALIARAALLHDIGKIGVPDAVLRKTGPLDDDERRLMQRHTEFGGAILAGSDSPLLRMAEQIALSHHEWWNGAGYPHQLVGTDITIAARIVAAADAFDALTNERPYKQAWSVEDTLAEIERFAGRQFDPQVVTALRAVVDAVAR